MSQTSVSSFYHSRKRGIEDEILTNKQKVIRLDNQLNPQDSSDGSNETNEFLSSKTLADDASKTSTVKTSTRQLLTAQRSSRSRTKQMQNVDGLETTKLVNFWKGGNLSPQKKPKAASTEVSNNEKTEGNLPGMTTPVKSAGPLSTNGMSVEEIRNKLKKSSKLFELKTSLNKLQAGFDKMDNKKEMTVEKVPVKVRKDDDETPRQLKPFKIIELEILSPTKRLTSPLKLKDSPMKNTLLGSPKTLATKRLFSPMKSPLEMSPVKAPAYQRFQNLAEKTSSSSSSLQLPFKYRYLLEIFKAIDAVCAMFYNRKEKITFKKLKPAVQRILRKNFYESHLSQIQKLMPNAYKFSQEKTRNFGSTSKQDYYQLVIIPNIESSDGCRELTLSPQLLIERASQLTSKLTDLVFAEHEKFLQNLEVPINVTRGSLKRWHPEFDLESVADVEHGDIPQPPNVEKYSSARDILATARNLFNCSTPMERALERLEEKKKEEKSKQEQHQRQQTAKVDATPTEGIQDETKKSENLTKTTSNLLKGVPQSLLEKIRAKQAAKALDTMTRRPSQEREAAKYSRLSDIARHARNVFITEKKGVILMENVLRKIENSYKGQASMKEIEELLRIISKEIPSWLSIHEIRNAMYIKLNKEFDLTTIVKNLDKLAAEKSK